MGVYRRQNPGTDFDPTLGRDGEEMNNHDRENSNEAKWMVCVGTDVHALWVRRAATTCGK
jgi:hypothetical protein